MVCCIVIIAPPLAGRWDRTPARAILVETRVIRCLWAGPAHVLERADEELFAVSEHRLGVPARETIAGPQAAATLRIMDRAWCEQRPLSRVVYANGSWGSFLAIPIWRDGQLWGVATEWFPHLPSVAVVPRRGPSPARRRPRLAAVRSASRP